MNSLYGALINQFDRFFDPRMGASTTGTGRQITTHMAQTIALNITGEKFDLRKETIMTKDGIENKYHIDTDVIITGDTDSTYFKTLASNKEEAIAVADAIGEIVNDSFPGFMSEAFCCQPEFDGLIKAGREIVADRSLFLAKKKYIARLVNLDGVDVDVNDKKALKMMGVEIKKSDTPKIIQNFLKDVVKMILDGKEYSELEKFVNQYRRNLRNNFNPIEIGISKSVNGLDEYYAEYNRYEKPGIKKVRLPGNARASINYNEMRKLLNDKISLEITNGSKIRVFYLKGNDFGFSSIAIPADADELPFWFDDYFQIDIKLTLEKLINDKLEIYLAPLGWEVPTPQSALRNSLLVF